MSEPVSGRHPALALLVRLLWAAAMLLPASGTQAAVVFSSLYSFGGGDDGWAPNGLLQGSDGCFYGTTEGGGTNYGGTVFKISTNGELTSLYSFIGGDDGSSPLAGLVRASDGYLYGTTQSGGGTNNFGTVFRISTDGTFATLCSTGSRNQLVQGSDGYFYGASRTVFKVSINGTLTTLYTFTNFYGINPNGLVQGSDGYLYGTTAITGVFQEAFGAGIAFKISTNGAYTRLCSFGNGTNGAHSYAALVQGSDGYLYGTTEFDSFGGHGWGAGTVFKMSTDGALTTLYGFGSITNANGDALDGAHPAAALVQGRDGNFYGTTHSGGANNLGTVFKISTNGALTTLYSFGAVQDTNGFILEGYYPTAALVQGGDGSFYGTTPCGGTNDAGTVFRLTILLEPQLTIIPSGPCVIVTWPTNANGFTLQSTTNLGPSAVWATNSPAPVVVNGRYAVTNFITSSQRFCGIL